MIITHRIKMEMSSRRVAPRVEAVQDDRYSRDLALELYEGGRPWQPGSGVMAAVTYAKPDGTGGSYNALPDGTPAWRIADNVVTVALAPQVCTAAGKVQLTVNLLQDAAQISTFPVELHVCRRPGIRFMSEDYYKLTGMVSDSGWEPDMYLGTDGEGRVVAVPVPAVQDPVTIDPSLTQAGQAADAKAVGEGLNGVVRSVNGTMPDQCGNVEVETGGIQTINGLGPDQNGNVELEIRTAGLPAPAMAEVGQYLRVLEVDEDGRVVAVEAVTLDEAADEPIEMYLYNALELPALPEWDKETYPYAAIFNSVLTYRLYCMKSLNRVRGEAVYEEAGKTYLKVTEATALCFKCKKKGLVDAAPGSVWEPIWYDDFYLGLEASIWSNCDLIALDDTLVQKGSVPLSVSRIRNLGASMPCITLTTAVDLDGALTELNSFDAESFEQLTEKELPCQVLINLGTEGEEEFELLTTGHFCSYNRLATGPAYLCSDGVAMLLVYKMDGIWYVKYSLR